MTLAPSSGDDLLIERAARALYEMRHGRGSWHALLPARKEAVRARLRRLAQQLPSSPIAGVDEGRRISALVEVRALGHAMITEKNIRTRDVGSASELLCPRCGGGNLHHEIVRVFDRHEDEHQTTVTQVRGSETIVSHQPSEGSGNPSSRRHGLTISFFCEACSRGQGDDVVLTIAQHKGATEVLWRFEGGNADSDDAAQLFRDDLARCSDLMPPSGTAFIDRFHLSGVRPAGQA
ncbi:hypothetical protein LRS10_09585 [Phenylobacterium sp. J426]|uniref:hypothetical protein n=1 Tax=Phenylobacterium sp. J426 TaxID=2898439 RepID=UPI0021516CB6|nr:hypothetical protein [Phenylobacterium sp. J426]MCR5874394.1 hypothetical protein [Phenylobacterium sp. J426]